MSRGTFCLSAFLHRQRLDIVFPTRIVSNPLGTARSVCESKLQTLFGLLATILQKGVEVMGWSFSNWGKLPCQKGVFGGWKNNIYMVRVLHYLFALGAFLCWLPFLCSLHLQLILFSAQLKNWIVKILIEIEMFVIWKRIQYFLGKKWTEFLL